MVNGIGAKGAYSSPHLTSFSKREFIGPSNMSADRLCRRPPFHPDVGLINDCPKVPGRPGLCLLPAGVEGSTPIRFPVRTVFRATGRWSGPGRILFRRIGRNSAPFPYGTLQFSFTALQQIRRKRVIRIKGQSRSVYVVTIVEKGAIFRPSVLQFRRKCMPIVAVAVASIAPRRYRPYTNSARSIPYPITATRLPATRSFFGLWFLDKS